MDGGESQMELAGLVDMVLMVMIGSTVEIGNEVMWSREKGKEERI